MSRVEHVLLHVVCELEGDTSGDADAYALRVWGLSEYLVAHTALSDYEYVHNCVKLEQDVRFAIVRLSSVDRPLARTVSLLGSLFSTKSVESLRALYTVRTGDVVCAGYLLTG